MFNSSLGVVCPPVCLFVCLSFGATKLVFFFIFILLFVKNCLLSNAIHDFTVWPRTGTYPADINRFQSNTRIKFREARSEEYEAVVDFINQHFVGLEPTTAACKLCEEGYRQVLC